MQEKSSISVCRQELRIPKPTPFGNKMFTPYQKYQMQLENNVRLLSVKFPSQPGLKIKQLLEQLGNDVGMVEELIQQQACKAQSQNNIKHTNKSKKQQPEMQGKILKKAIASLYAKLKKAQSQVRNLEQNNQKLEKEKQFYKNRNKLLAEQHFSDSFCQNLNIF